MLGTPLLQKRIMSSVDQVTSAIREAIISGRLAPGARLLEAEISEQLGVSRSPIREAFRILESQRLVTIIPNKGVHVVRIDEKDLWEIYELRILLECYAIRVACESMTDEELEEFESFADIMTRDAESKDYLNYLRNSHDFHEYYIARCKNKRLFDLFKVLRDTILSVQMLACSYPILIKESLSEHKRILLNVLNRDQDAAEVALKAHLMSGYERAKKYLPKS
jgi:DNA-binding GntR family transcriptional regulator